MNLYAALEGLKFPDEMVTRFFFKNGLQAAPGRVLELGCGNANNLALFGAYGWHCAGLDIAPELLAQGQRNFQRLALAPPQLMAGDLNDPLPDFGPLDALLLPSSLYYVHVDRARQIVHHVAPMLAPGAPVFCRFRTPADHRHGQGDDLGQDCFRLTIAETSEFGCVNAFYTLERMLDLLAPCGIDTDTLRVMTLVFDNLGRDERMIRNNEIVLWGRTKTAAART